MYEVIKRDGKIVKYDIQKIRKAIIKAFEACNKNYSDDAIDFLALKATSDFENKIKDNKITVEQIQDSVEAVLIKADYADVAKAYILYRKQREKIRNASSTLVDYKEIVDNYLKINDWRVKENSTVTYSVGGLILSNSGAVTANYWLSEAYDDEIANAHKNADIHIHDLSMLTGYCAGWSLKQLIQEGLGGVPGKITSSPASHLSTLCNQMVNFLGIMQNEWAGAQAFSSFDTYLAPFVKKDNLTYKDVKQCIQSFIYGVNTPSRWGCVTSDTEVLSVDGFKKFNELNKHDLIYTWNNGKLELNPVREVVIKPYKGKMHEYLANGYNQTITPTHRMLIKKYNKNEYVIAHSEDIFNSKTPYALPVHFKSSSLTSSELSDSEIKLAAAVYTDGTIDIRNDTVHKITIFKSPKRDGNDLIVDCCNKLGLKYSLIPKQNGYNSESVNQYVFYGEDARFLFDLVQNKKIINKKFLEMSAEQSLLFLKTWAAFDGSKEKFKLQYDNDVIASQLQHIALRAGFCSYIQESKKANYVKIRQSENVYPTSRTEIDYDDIVWCPNVENGTAVFRKNKTVFISGQTQAPFTNITLDWTVPKDLAELNCIVGGKEVDFQYKDCQKEMDMINKAFIEIMIEGDANGRGFQYPIPTYSITRDFDWSDTENNRLLFEMTAKYGTPYFSNYINSDMEPSDVRSMAILGTQEVIYSDEHNIISKNEIRHLVNNWLKADVNHKPKYKMLMNGKFYPISEMFKIPYNKYPNYVEITLDNNYKQSFSWDHKCVVLRGGQKQIILSQDVKPDDKMLLCKNSYDSYTNKGTYEAGRVVGYYLAEGWIAHNDSEINFAINKERLDIANNIKNFFEPLGFRVTIKDYPGNIYKVFVYGHGASGFVKDYVSGKKATEKRLSINVWDSSKEFRQGIYDGYLETDGSPTNKMFAHTTNKVLCEDLIVLAASLGKYFKYSVNNKNTRYFKPDKSDKTSFTSYKLSITEYEEFEDYYIIPVKSVENKKSVSNYVYNFTIDTDEHLYTLPNGLITHQCCRLRLDLRELRKKSGGFFGSGESTGSVGVVTINMPRLAYLAKDEKDFYERLDKVMDIAARSLNIKRKIITQLLENGLYPYTKRYLGSFNNHFSTIGLVGMNEAGLNAKWLKKDMTSKETQDWTAEVLTHMRNRLSDYQEEYGDLYNLEATPAESTSFRLAKHDRKKYPDIITAAKSCDDTPYYTNSSHLPVGYTEDVFSALDIQDDLQTLYTSGTVFHAFLGEKLPDWKAAATLVRKIAENYKLPYYTMSPTYSVCKNHGYISGEVYKCPECGEKTEVYSRITGYYRPVQNWNDGKTQEFKDRKEYNISNSHLTKKEEFKEDVFENSFCASCQIEEKVYLFTTETCPNCKIACATLDKVGFVYEKIIANKNPDLTNEFNIKQAPTLVIIENGEINKYTGVSDIKKYINSKK